MQSLQITFHIPMTGKDYLYIGSFFIKLPDVVGSNIIFKNLTIIRTSDTMIKIVKQSSGEIFNNASSTYDNTMKNYTNEYKKREEEVSNFAISISSLLSEIKNETSYDMLEDTFKKLHVYQHIVKKHEEELAVDILDRPFSWGVKKLEHTFIIERDRIYIDDTKFFSSASIMLISWVTNIADTITPSSEESMPYTCSETLRSHIPSDLKHPCNTYNIDFMRSAKDINSMQWIEERNAFVVITNTHTICEYLPEKHELSALSMTYFPNFGRPAMLKTSLNKKNLILIVKKDLSIAVLATIIDRENAKHDRSPNLCLNRLRDFSQTNNTADIITDVALSDTHVYILRKNSILVYDILGSLKDIYSLPSSPENLNIIACANSQVLICTVKLPDTTDCTLWYIIYLKNGLIERYTHCSTSNIYTGIEPSPWPNKLIAFSDNTNNGISKPGFFTISIAENLEINTVTIVQSEHIKHSKCPRLDSRRNIYIINTY